MALKRTRPTSPVAEIDGRGDALDADENVVLLDHRRAGLLLKAMRLLEDDASKRAALPALTALERTRLCGPI